MLVVSKEDLDKLIKEGGQESAGFMRSRSDSWKVIPPTEKDAQPQVQIQEGLYSVLESYANQAREIAKSRENTVKQDEPTPAWTDTKYY